MSMFKKTSALTPEEYIDSVSDLHRADIEKLHSLIKKTVPNLKAHICSGMLGYGEYHYRYASGREGDWALILLASQKNYISLYVCSVDVHGYIAEQYKNELGKVSVGKSCIRFKKLEDLNLDMLRKVIQIAEKSPGLILQKI